MLYCTCISLAGAANRLSLALSNRFCPPISLSVCQGVGSLVPRPSAEETRVSCQCVIKILGRSRLTTKGLNTSKRHSNNYNSEKIVYLKVAEAVLFARISSYFWPYSRSQTAQLRLGTRLSWPRIVSLPDLSLATRD